MKSNQKGFGVFEALLLLLVIGLIVGAGLFVYKRNNNSAKTPDSKTVLKHELALVDCGKIKQKLQQLDAFDGDICYAAPINTSNETFEYVVVDQSESYRLQVQKDLDENCDIYCGGYLPPTGSHDFIIRANGVPEIVVTGWTVVVDDALESLTGCPPLDNSDKYQEIGEFVIDKGRIGIHISVNDLASSQRFGSSCNINTDLIAFTSNEEPGLSIESLAVKYELTDPTKCVSKDVNSSSANTDSEVCLRDQASMRGDINICPYYDSLGTVYNDCITAVATRNRDLTICQKLSEKYKQQCTKAVESAKGIYGGEIQATGL